MKKSVQYRAEKAGYTATINDICVIIHPQALLVMMEGAQAEPAVPTPLLKSFSKPPQLRLSDKATMTGDRETRSGTCSIMSLLYGRVHRRNHDLQFRHFVVRPRLFLGETVRQV
jgi:hypothetical protein